ncbi:MAG: bifunctional transaldolase/phosoglucose isomerase [Gemmatimonadales bacterium]|jgi:transaldolase/glucose-6-phosphate isomerase
MDSLHQLAEYGQSYWIDNLTRTMIRGGELERRVKEEGLRGVTSNPAIFSKAISQGSDYDQQIEELVAERRSIAAIYEALVVSDIQDACDILRPVYDDTKGADGFVSLEVSPYLAHETHGSIEEARRLFREVDRPNVLIKIPGTSAGVPAIEQLLTEGINVNITLLFSIRAYEAVAEAYLRALERRVEAGEAIDRVSSVASFFLSRIDVLADELLSHRIRSSATADYRHRPEHLLGKIATANAKLAYQSFRQIFAGERWQALKNKGARLQRVLWASTSTKNPLYSDVKYVEPLIGPETVNTMPNRTITAFADHGIVDATVERGIENSERVLADLQATGIDLDRVTDQLLEEGIQKFIDPFDRLIATLATERARFLGDHAVSQKVASGAAESLIAAGLAALDEQRFGRRLFDGDPYLWKSEAKHVERIRNRLGWLASPETFIEKTDELAAFADEVRDSGYDRVVHLGMGGSSLCPEVSRQIFGSAEGRPELTVLDDTDPAAVRATLAEIDPPRTLFIVASKSGTTTETISFYRAFYKALDDTGVEHPAEHFVAITDPGTPLAHEAHEKRFRRCFENPADIGGRYSALSYFGLVPMAIVGVDVRTLLAAALQMRRSCGPEVPAESNPGLQLGTVLGLYARSGRDKVTFALSPSIGPFGLWVEQLIAESTGKDGRGLVPIEGEPLGAPEVYGDDRIFVHLRLRSDEDDQTHRKLAALEQAGHPVVRIEIADRLALGAEYFHWELATAVAGAVIGVDAFDEPNVAESKRNTRNLLERQKRDGSFDEGEPLVNGARFSIHADRRAAWLQDHPTDDVEDFLAGFLDSLSAGDYLALLPYFRNTPERSATLGSLRTRLRDRLKVATAVGYGPRYLHSTGQLHKGGPDNGSFIILTAEHSEETQPIPAESYGFATLHRAQALGDYQSLVERGRRVIRVHLANPTETALVHFAAALAGR